MTYKIFAQRVINHRALVVADSPDEAESKFLRGDADVDVEEDIGFLLGGVQVDELEEQDGN